MEAMTVAGDQATERTPLVAHDIEMGHGHGPGPGYSLLANLALIAHSNLDDAVDEGIPRLFPNDTADHILHNLAFAIKKAHGFLQPRNNTLQKMTPIGGQGFPNEVQTQQELAKAISDLLLGSVATAEEQDPIEQMLSETSTMEPMQAAISTLLTSNEVLLNSQATQNSLLRHIFVLLWFRKAKSVAIERAKTLMQTQFETPLQLINLRYDEAIRQGTLNTTQWFLTKAIDLCAGIGPAIVAIIEQDMYSTTYRTVDAIAAGFGLYATNQAVVTPIIVHFNKKNAITAKEREITLLRDRIIRTIHNYAAFKELEDPTIKSDDLDQQKRPPACCDILEMIKDILTATAMADELRAKLRTLGERGVVNANCSEQCRSNRYDVPLLTTLEPERYRDAFNLMLIDLKVLDKTEAGHIAAFTRNEFEAPFKPIPGRNFTFQNKVPEQPQANEVLGTDSYPAVILGKQPQPGVASTPPAAELYQTKLKAQ